MKHDWFSLIGVWTLQIFTFLDIDAWFQRLSVILAIIYTIMRIYVFISDRVHKKKSRDDE